MTINYSILKWPSMFFAILVCFNLAAQDINNVVASKKTPDGRYNFLKFNAFSKGQFRSASNQPDDIKKILGLGAKHAFVPDEEVNNIRGFKTDQSGANHTRYSQYFNGIKIEYGVITLHLKDGALNVLTGDYFNIDENFSTKPVLTAAGALNKAISFVGAKKYSWEDSSITNKELKTPPKGELVICRNYMEQAKQGAAVPQMELAYKFAIYATVPLRYDYIYVSARTGNIIHVNPIIKHVDGTAATRYSGSKTIATTQASTSSYLLKDSSASYNITTYNLNRGSNYTSAEIFSDNNNNWTADEYNNSNFDNAALDAHWGAMMTQDYWKTVHKRNSFDNKGTKIRSYVHYGSNFANAFWDGYVMTYGDGDGGSMGPLTSIDICGHEIGHAVCQYTANLVYSYESGAINEGFSDIWGACIKKFADPSKNTWLMADEISKTGTPFRSLVNPKSQQQPDTYKGTNWYYGYGDNGGVHYNSGVMNHWFYILSEGKTGTNDKDVSYDVKGIGITKAAQIAYRAENLYLFPNAQYSDVRLSAIQAAEDLFGAGSNELVQTTKAWNAVGVTEVLAVPDSLIATVADNKVVVKWRFKSSQNIGGFKLERAINGTNNFGTVAMLDSSARSFTDDGFVNNSINQYRIRSFRDEIFSDYSTVASVSVGNAPFAMTNGDFTKCGVTFFDPGGSGSYSAGSYTMTLHPSETGKKVRVAFTEFNTGYDNLAVYNGPSTNSPAVGYYSGKTLPPDLESSAPGGELTFVFNSYYNNNYPGWKAFISCNKSLPAPTNLRATSQASKTVTLSWNDNANDETKYVVERSLSDSLNFLPIISLAANATGYTDTSAPDNSFLYYRVAAYRDSALSLYSNIVSAFAGPQFVMQEGSYSTCGASFFDPGGTGNYLGGLYNTATIRPSVAGRSLKVEFKEFNLSYWDNLAIYDGPNTSSPLLGRYSGTTLPPVLKSTASGGELTFVFYASYQSSAPGWIAYLSCYKPVSPPTNLQVAKNASSGVDVNWLDNADDETKYVVERSVNASSLFVPIAELPANTSKYTDATAPANALLYYRVRAFRDTLPSSYSDRASIEAGNAPFLMKDATVVSCDKVFMDQGGDDVIPPGYFNKVATFKPATPGNRVKITFSKFQTSAGLTFYNGPSTSSPYLGSLSYYSKDSYVFEGTGPDGSLTVVANGNLYSSDSGWVAQVTCYKPVAKPSAVKAILNSQQKVIVSWTDNSDDETKYVVERSVNASSLFAPVAQLPANTSQYKDSTAPVNSLLYYRVRAVRDTLSSFYSDTGWVEVGNIPFFMRDSTLVTCNKVFMDPGGEDVTPHGRSYYYTATFKPAIAGNNISVAFTKFGLAGGYLTVYNGSSVNSPFLASYSGSSAGPVVINGTSPDGSLTFVYSSSYYYSDSGWVAYVSCYKPVRKPSAVNVTEEQDKRVKITWTDNANDETKYVIERSVNGTSQFVVLGEVPANSTSYFDLSAPANSFLYYRVKAYRDTLGSFYSDTASIGLGNVPFIMKDSTIVTCDKVFMDPGGADIIPRNNNYYSLTATFKPGVAGSNVVATFSNFRLEGTLNVYDGSSTFSPLIGTYSNYTPPPAVLRGTGPDGSLTFRYGGYGGYMDSGWVAQVSCYKPVAKPTRLKATSPGFNKVELTWTDNADNETKYVVERSVNAPSRYVVISELPANAANFTDNAAPANSTIFYRVRAYRDTLGSVYSDTGTVSLGNAPLIMEDTTLVTCDRVFLDPGGNDVVDRTNNYVYKTTTFKPAVSGNKIRVTFNKFSIRGTLVVYDGAAYSGREIGRFGGGYSYPLEFNATGDDGTLTFQYQGYQDWDSGWIAQVSCYKAVATPSQLKVVSQTSQQIKLSWTDNSDDETKYVVERSVNGYSLFSPIAELAANTNQYTDNAPPVNSYIHYRVRAFRDTLTSLPSDTASVALGNTPFLMKDSTVITCNKVFMDPGGADAIPSSVGYYNMKVTFKPEVAGNSLKAIFRKFRLTWYANLYVYDGPSENSPLLASLSNYSITPLKFTSSGSDGSLTFVYRGYASSSDSGWLAEITCFKPVAAPTNLNIDTGNRNKPKLNWADNANNESGYIVERSITDTLHYKPIIKLPANATSYTDTTAPGNSFMYYRVAAYIDTSNSDYSNAASVVTGEPFVMTNTTISTCGVVFLDPGGFGNYNSGYYTTTVKPATAGNLVRVQFSEFNIDGYLQVYNGPSTSSPLLGYFSNSNQLNLLQSSAVGGELTFVFNPYYSNYYPGWTAYLSCYKPVGTPLGVKAIAESSLNINLSWKDNADDETKYVVERSVNAPSLFTAIAQLPANSVQFTDATAPANSLLFYRVRAYRDTAGSEYSDGVSISNGSAPFLMKDSTLATCEKIFMDPGGVDIIPSNIAYNTTTTFKPAAPGNNIRVSFSKLEIGGILFVYNGSSSNSPKIAELNRFSNPSSVFNSTAADGALTFVYSHYSNNDPGWVARVTCYKPVAKPTGVKAVVNSQKIKVTWTDNADDETKYVIERSVNASSLFASVAEISANATSFTDSTAPLNSLLYYRVRALRDTLSSLYSDTASVTFGNAPFLMADSTLITCDKVFMDPGGVDVMQGTWNSYSIQTTFKPAISGNKVKIAFSKLRINGSLFVYNGSSTNSQIGYLGAGSSPSAVFSSTAEDGSLTIRYSLTPYSDSGWVAQVSCYKPVAKPSALKAAAASLQRVQLAWKDNADDETRYVVERSINAPSLFKEIAQVPANATLYLDSTAPANAAIYYRVRAFRDTLASFYSDPAYISVGDAPFIMKDSTLITCDKIFMDPGGNDVIPSSYHNLTTTFKPGNSNSRIKVAFSKFLLSDYLSVYDGPNTSSPLIARISSYYTNLSPVFTATNETGSLTFAYSSSYYFRQDSGWEARAMCEKLVSKPSGLKAVEDNLHKVALSWKDNADDETKYVVERSVNASTLYKKIADLPANTSQFADSSAPANSVIYYRVRAYRDTLASEFSDTTSIALGDAPFPMRDSTVITCNKVFMDPGGVDVSQGYYYVRSTFKPGAAGNNIRVSFSKLSPDTKLYVYNGSSTSSPLLGVIDKYNANRVFNSTAIDGSLTFVYPGNSWNADSGWLAQISCFKPVSPPERLIANVQSVKNVSLTWTDMSADESGFVIERSFNDSLNFIQLATVSANSTSYTDTTAPANSYVFYRVSAFRDDVNSLYSNTVFALTGNVFAMRGGKIAACGITFLDPGGEGSYGNNVHYTTTFISPTSGSKIRATFNSFNTESCCDFLNVYNGPDSTYPLLGTYLGATIPKVLQSSAPNGELTFVFTSDASTTGAGWNAMIDCIKSNDTLATCSTDSNAVNTFQANVSGSICQWQKFNGKTFENIYDDSNKSGTKTSTLQIKNAALKVLENMRCVINGNYVVNFVIVKGNRWTGQMSSNWNDPQNWSCGKVPDANTDVLIEGGKATYPVLNSNGECRSVMILTGANLKISSGYKLNIRH